VTEASRPRETPPDLWRLLESAVCRRPRDPRGRIAIEDSKKLKRPNDAAGHPLEYLERGVLACLRCIDPDGAPLNGVTRTPRASVVTAPGGGTAAQSANRAIDFETDDDMSLLRQLGAAPAAQPPWVGAPLKLPLANDKGLLGIASQRLRRALDAAELRLRSIEVAAIDAPEFNIAFERTRSKASINTSMGMEILDRIARRFPQQDLFVEFDRHGGRTHYREELALNFPHHRLRVIEESDEGSRYELRDGVRCMLVAWGSEAESRHLTVALASMAAKLVRELWMLRLNRYFAHFLPELKPTAGYVEDGRRWLKEVGPHLAELGLDPRRLVRMA